MPALAEQAAAQQQATPRAAHDGSTASSSVAMRRVASAPAFKHASCYQGAPSAATAVAAAAAVAAAEAHAAARAASSSSGGGSVVARWRRPRTSAPRPQPPAACSSCAGGACRCLEVYVVSRAFTEFGGPVIRALPRDAREHLVDMGICHYMTVFKTPDGRLVQFDFGPLGGDVQKAHGPVGALLRRAHEAALQAQQQQAGGQQQLRLSLDGGGGAPGRSSSGNRGVLVHCASAPALAVAGLALAGQQQGSAQEAAAAAAGLLQLHAASDTDTSSGTDRPPRGVVGEIRERSLDALPPACMYMGRTSLSLEDIRQYNAAQGALAYSLHESDCRHYVNSLVQYTTGVERSTQHLKRHYFVSRHADRWLWYGWCISATQLVTDVGNWGHVQAGAAATLLAITGRSTLASLKSLAGPMVPALKGLVPAAMGLAGGAAAAGGGGGAGAAAAAGGGGGGAAATMIGSLATTLKLPAALLLKRPLAAGAAAGGAGAAAAVMRDGGSGGAAAAAGSASGTGAGQQYRPGLAVAFGSLGRPLRVFGDGVAHGLRSAVLGVRRLAVGDGQAALQQRGAARQPVLAAAAGMVGAPAAVGGPGDGGGNWWWGRRRQQLQQQQPRAVHQQQQQIVPAPVRGWWGVRQQHAVMARGSSTGDLLTAPTRISSSSSLAAVQPVAAPGVQQPAAVPARGLAAVAGHVGRHIASVGSAAARASGQLAGLAFGGRSSAGAPTAGGVSGGQLQLPSSSQSSSSSLGTRSRSMPSLLMGPPPAAAAAAARSTRAGPSSSPGAVQSSGTATAVAGGSGGALLLDRGSRCGNRGGGGSHAAADLVWCSSGAGGSSSSLLGSSPSRGGGRQVLNLPAPRLSFSRATTALIVRQ